MAESSRHIPTLGIISNNVDVTEGSSSPLKVSPRSMESGDDTGDDMSVSYPSPSMTTSGKPSPTRIKIVKHRKVIVKRQKKQSQQSPSSHFDRSVTEAGETTVDNQTCDNDPSNTDNDEEIVAIPKPGCRYGAGCTHIADPAHRMKFWHPVVQELTEDEIQSNFICNECGFATKSLKDLQIHLKRKTAWSNESLVGCRVNCLIDSKEWLEGFVCQFHKSGKHRVEFRALNEKKWMIMKKIAFYIIERPIVANNPPYGGEVKDNEDIHDNLAPIEDWNYCESISVEYAFAQSVLFKICGNSLQETGHLTKGHVSLTHEDKSVASQGKCSFLYGELLPRGANKAMESERLSVCSATTLFDLGMGTGKILIQAFLQFRNLRYIYGVELAEGRFRLAEEIVLRMVDLLGPENYNVHIIKGKHIIVMENRQQSPISGTNDVNGNTAVSVDSDNKANVEALIQSGYRVLHFQCGNMFDVAPNLHLADVVMMETDIPHDLYYDLHVLLSNMKDNARMLSYLDFRKVFQSPSALNLKQLDINKPVSDRYPTSWSVQRGHHFFLWIKTPPEDSNNSNWGMGMQMIKKQQTDEVEHSSPKSESDSQSEDSAMDGCLPFYFCTYYFSSRITTSRVSSPVKPAPMIDILDDEHNGIRNSEIDSCYPRTSQHQSDQFKPNIRESEGKKDKCNSPRQDTLEAEGKKKKKKNQNVDDMTDSSPRGVGIHAVTGSTAYADNSSVPSLDQSSRQQSIGLEKVSSKKKPQNLQQFESSQELGVVPGLNNNLQFSPLSNASPSESHAFNPDIRSRLSKSTNNSPRPSPDSKPKTSGKGKMSACTTPSMSPRAKDSSDDIIDQRCQPDVCVVANGGIVIQNAVRNGSEVDNYSNLNILNDQSTQRASPELESFPQSSLLTSQNPKSCEALIYGQRFKDEEGNSIRSVGADNHITKVIQQPSGISADGRRKSSDESVAEFRRDCSDTRRRRSYQESSCSVQ